MTSQVAADVEDKKHEADNCCDAANGRAHNEHDRYTNGNGRWLKETSNNEREAQQEQRAGDYNQC